MSENYEIDFAVGYTFELLEKLVGDCASRESLSVDEYIKKMKNEYITDVASLFDDLVVSTDKEEIRILIGEMLDAKCDC